MADLPLVKLPCLYQGREVALQGQPLSIAGWGCIVAFNDDALSQSPRSPLLTQPANI